MISPRPRILRKERQPDLPFSPLSRQPNQRVSCQFRGIDQRVQDILGHLLRHVGVDTSWVNSICQQPFVAAFGHEKVVQPQNARFSALITAHAGHDKKGGDTADHDDCFERRALENERHEEAAH